jgi:hypothetical protein
MKLDIVFIAIGTTKTWALAQPHDQRLHICHSPHKMFYNVLHKFCNVLFKPMWCQIL